MLWANDTDVAVIAIHYFHQSKAQEVFIKIGVGEKTRFLPIHDVSRTLGSDLCAMVPGLHALSGCDSVSAFFKKGKKLPWKIVKEEPEKYENLSQLGENSSISDAIVSDVEKLVCVMYSSSTVSHSNDINELRYKLFCQKQHGSESLPPSRNALEEHTKRANYQALIWKSAHIAKPILPKPENHGWMKLEEKLVLVYSSKPGIPREATEFVTCGCKKSKCSTGSCKCYQNELSCTEGCSCFNGPECCNAYKYRYSLSD